MQKMELQKANIEISL